QGRRARRRPLQRRLPGREGRRPRGAPPPHPAELRGRGRGDQDREGDRRDPAVRDPGREGRRRQRMKKSALLDASLIAQLDHLELVVRRLFAGRTQGEKRSKRRGTGPEFADYREYTQGDDLRHIDWNVYGRLDRLFL